MRVVESKVARVTLYASGAVVTRRVRVLGDDENICVEGLPLELADDSVRVVCPQGTRAVEQASIGFAVPAVDPGAQPALDEALAELRLAKALADRRHETLQVAVSQLSNLELRRRMGPEDGVPAKASPTRARLQWLGLQAQQLRRVQDDLADAREECRLAVERLAEAQAAAQASSSARQTRPEEARKSIVVRLAGGSAAELELSYRVARCRWAPSYILRIREGEDAALEMRALIAQQTGEDWSGAAVSVSTASTMQWVELPEVKAVKVGRRQPPTTRPGWRAAPQNTDALYADFDRARDLEPSVPKRVSMPPEAMMAFGAPAKPKSRSKKKRRAPGTSGGAPPPPPQMEAQRSAPMPAPMAAAPARSLRASSLMGGGVDGFAGGAMEDLDDMPMAEEALAEGAMAVLQEPAELSVPRRLMDYGALRMQGPESAQRGTLQPRDDGPQLSAQRALQPPSGHQWLIRDADFDYTYDADGHHNIPSDGAPHLVAVLQVSPTLERRYVCVPGQSSDVFRLCSARNPLDAPLPAGPLDVYQDGQFSLTTPLEAVAPGGRFELGLGVEQGIKVARRVSFEEDTEGLLKRQHAFEHHVEVEVQNLLKRPIALEVRERVPVAARRDDPDVEVTERRIEPKWDLFDPPGEELKGGRRWKLTVPPEARTTLNAQWVVRVPRGLELRGGNRRAR